MDSLDSSQGKGEKRSLNSVVAMLKSSSKKSRLDESDTCKQNKLKKLDDELGISEKENNIETKQTDIMKNKSCASESDAIKKQVHVQNNTSPRKDKTSTKQNDKIKNVIKTESSVKTEVESSPAQLIVQSPLYSTTPVQLSTTHVNEMHTLSNMVRNQPGLNEIMKTRCQKVRLHCKDLPKNPLLWTKKHVAMFIQNADYKKYAKRFFEQEIDGHSFLLLTVWELHHVLGVHLGPAMKIHDYIFSLQQLVNDAYQKSKNDPHRGCASQANNESAATDKGTKEGDREIEPTGYNKKRNGNIEAKSVTTRRTKKESSIAEEALKTEIKKESKTIHKVDELFQNQPVFGVQPMMNPEQQVRFIYQPARPPMGDMNSGEYTLIPTSEGITPTLIQYGSPYLTPYSLIRPPTHLIPIQYIQQPPPASEEKSSSSTGTTTTQVSPSQQIVMSCLPSSFKETETVYQLPPDAGSVKTSKQKKKTAEIVKMIDVKKTEQTIIPTIIPSLTTNKNPERYLRNIYVELESQDLWNAFHKLGTEMILTRAGRRMFPTLQVSITGMDPKSKYVILVDFAPSDHYRYKFEYESSSWQIACEETTPPPGRVYIHPESPANGDEWMRNIVDFTRCKLTNNIADSRGHILMHSMHKYQPRMHIIYWDGSLPLQINPFELLRLGCRREFVFPQTQFIAVTAYQNSQITHLKIESNPFARGFRGDWRKYSETVSKKTKSKVKEEQTTSETNEKGTIDGKKEKLTDASDELSDDNEDDNEKHVTVKQEPDHNDSHDLESIVTDNG